ncbi:MAG TPA: hypothetical protein VJ738_17805 [Steroidobacteraceae bacterium]|nr:hypothetical protein [Steroidobacteraceae bacterium]
MEHGRLPQEHGGTGQGETSAPLSDLTRWLAILAAPHGYVASAHLLGGIRGNRLLLHAVRKAAAGDEHVQEIGLESLETLGAAAVASAFDRSARAAFAAAERLQPPLSHPAKG